MKSSQRILTMFVGVAALQFGLFYHFAVVDLNKEVIFLMLDFLSLYHSFKIVFLNYVCTMARVQSCKVRCIICIYVHVCR